MVTCGMAQYAEIKESMVERLADVSDNNPGDRRKSKSDFRIKERIPLRKKSVRYSFKGLKTLGLGRPISMIFIHETGRRFPPVPLCS